MARSKASTTFERLAKFRYGRPYTKIAISLQADARAFPTTPKLDVYKIPLR